MSDLYESRVDLLTGAVNGTNRTFQTQSKYIAGTLRVIWNGQVYEADDDRKGWTEIDDQTIETDIPPRTGDVLQAFYKDKNTGGPSEIHNVVGSPFHPYGWLP